MTGRNTAIPRTGDFPGVEDKVFIKCGNTVFCRRPDQSGTLRVPDWASARWPVMLRMIPVIPAVQFIIQEVFAAPSGKTDFLRG